ncbi:MAG: polyprenyl synthetase family protein [Candidatus Aenigmatarchaeota archaeon]
MTTREEVYKILKKYKPKIDKSMERYVPRRFDEETLEKILGKARYVYNVETLQESLAKPIWEFLDRGGKRMRPVMMILVYEAFGGSDKDIMNYVASPELFHNGTLMVDDIEDKSEKRRGKPCTHKIFGEDIAINAGNTLYFFAFLPFRYNRDELGEEMLNKAYELLLDEFLRVSAGQGMDIAWHNGLSNADTIGEAEYLQMCSYKTGCLTRLSAKLGALLAEAPEDDIEKVGLLAEKIGVAFQIQDDILDVTSEEFKEGKGELGHDIKEGKRTLIAINALEEAEENDRERLLEILKKETEETTDEEVREAIDIFKKYGSIEYSKRKAREMVKHAWKEAEGVLEAGEAKEDLRSFADYLVERRI